MYKEISEDEYLLLPIYCFDIILSYLKIVGLEEVFFPDMFKNMRFPLFVTWTFGKSKDLRGCLGTFTSSNLEENLNTFAYHSAFHDNRFSPISLKEIFHLNCGVSLLINFEIAENALDWVIGKHGITIDFICKKRKYHATFLPEIALEKRWDKLTTLSYLIKKSGM